jgi:hypothetical protein
MISFLKKKLINSLSDDELMGIFASRFSPKQRDFSQEMTRQVFQDMSKVDNIDAYLEDMMYNDMNRHFSATEPEDQFNIKGAFLRTSYVKSNIIKARRGWKNVQEDKGFAGYFK